MSRHAASCCCPLQFALYFLCQHVETNNTINSNFRQNYWGKRCKSWSVFWRFCVVFVNSATGRCSKMLFSLQSVQVGAAKCCSRCNLYRSVQQNAVLGAVCTGRCSKMLFSVQSVQVGAVSYRIGHFILSVLFQKFCSSHPLGGVVVSIWYFAVCQSVCSTFCCMSVSLQYISSQCRGL
jgi:hypothetical protein